MKRYQKSMLVFALALGLAGGCATLYNRSQVSVYNPQAVTIEKVSKGPNQTVRLEYKLMMESYFYSPGVDVEESQDAITLRVLRVPIDTMESIPRSWQPKFGENIHESRTVGKKLVVDIENKNDKPIYLLDAQGQRSLIYEAQAARK